MQDAGGGKGYISQDGLGDPVPVPSKTRAETRDMSHTMASAMQMRSAVDDSNDYRPQCKTPEGGRDISHKMASVI